MSRTIGRNIPQPEEQPVRDGQVHQPHRPAAQRHRLPRHAPARAERAERAQASLEAAGFGDFEITETKVAGQPGARLDCVKRDAGRTWAVRQYFVGRGDSHFVLGCGSSGPDEGDALSTQIAERFEFLSG